MLIRLIAALCMLPALTFAQPVLVPGFDECADLQVGKGEPLGSCVRGAFGNCLAWPAGETAGTACFIDAKDEWGDLLGQRLQRIRDRGDERLGKIAEIETRYELERSLRECDRRMELMLLDVPQDDQSAYLRAQCEATAVAATLVTLILRAGQAE